MIKKIVLLFLLPLFLSAVQAQKSYEYPIIRVIDGDTVVFQASFLPEPLKPELSLRIYGVDTPEKGYRAGCVRENNRSIEATAFVKKSIEQAKQKRIVLMEWDKFGGRVLGDLLLDGQSLRELLIKNNFARPYFGDKKKSWCD